VKLEDYIEGFGPLAVGIACVGSALYRFIEDSSIEPDNFFRGLAWGINFGGIYLIGSGIYRLVKGGDPNEDNI